MPQRLDRTEKGPFGPNGAPTATANTGAVVLANQFDTAVTSTSGVYWLRSQELAAPYTPLTLAPGASGTITVTITPKAAVGTVVRGFLDVDTFNSITFSRDQVTSIPYTYRSASSYRTSGGALRGFPAFCGHSGAAVQAIARARRL